MRVKYYDGFSHINGESYGVLISGSGSGDPVAGNGSYEELFEKLSRLGFLFDDPSSVRPRRRRKKEAL